MIVYHLFQLYQWYQITQRTTYVPNHLSANPTKCSNTLKQFVGNLHVSAHPENIPFIILLMSAFFCKKKINVFCPKKDLYSKQQCESCLRDILVLFSVFVRQKVTITENITFADSVSGIRSPDCSKLAKNPKNDNDVTIFRHDVCVKYF